MRRSGLGGLVVLTALAAVVLGTLDGPVDAVGSVEPGQVARQSGPPTVAQVLAGATGQVAGRPKTATTAKRARRATQLPFGGQTVFPGRILVAFYGTAGTPALGVLGEGPIDRVTRRLRRQARPYAGPNRDAQIVYELIVTVADAYPGRDGDYSHDIAKDKVRRMIRAAHRNRALLVLDLQPGRSGFLTVARRWKWALRDPWVGLALDPEWRMGPHQVPAQTIGHVGAAEVNRVTAWLRDVTARNELPEKLLLLHQFRTDMVRDIDRIRSRRGLVLIQHVDGFGTRQQKLATYHAVARPDRFRMGFKLFYDEDIDMMPPSRVLKIRPRVRYVSYQ